MSRLIIKVRSSAHQENDLIRALLTQRAFIISSYKGASFSYGSFLLASPTLPVNSTLPLQRPLSYSFTENYIAKNLFAPFQIVYIA